MLIQLRCQPAKFIHAYVRLLKQRGDFRQHFVHDGFWQGIDLAGVAGGQVDHARLIATHYAGGLDAGHGHREAQAAGELAAVLHATGLEPRFLEIELTESVLMHHTGQVLETLNAIKALGVGVTIDDFGTGYSSLAYLKRYPIDKLKIDRSFVMDTPQSADDVAIVTAIIQMGHSLQLNTVAECVETAEQKELLHRLGCDLVQGFLVSAPMDAQATQRWLSPQG